MAAVPPPTTFAVAGATGWLGGHVVASLLEAGYQVVALVRPGTDASSLEKKPGVVVSRCDVTDAQSLMQTPQGSIMALISCIGHRDSADPDEEIYRTLRDGTINLYHLAKASKATRFITIAGGIHKTSDGNVRCEMIRSAARESGLAVVKSEPDGGPAIIAVDATVFFKDAATMFDVIAKSNEKGQASLSLVQGSWSVRCNPISGRDLAERMVSLLTAADLPSSGRVTAGGPEELSFAELVDAAGDALGGVSVAHKTIPRWLARTIIAGARLGAATLGSRKARALERFFSFLWVIGTDESPNSLIGEPGGRDSVTDFYKELAAKQNQSTISDRDKVNLALEYGQDMSPSMLLLVFAVLNVILLARHYQAVPSRDIAASLITLLVLVAAVQFRPRQQADLKTTSRMKKLLGVLMLFEITFLLVIPWSLLLALPVMGESKDSSAFILVPHLYIFQTQIALEQIVVSKHRHGMAFWYTVIFNTYRGLFGVGNWIWRYRELRHAMHDTRLISLLMILLPTAAVILWLASNVLVALVWYPCLEWKTKKLE